jgi:GTPase SAR1 family protein
MSSYSGPRPVNVPTADSTGSSVTRNKEVMSSQIEKKCFVKIVAIGDSGVGKTSLI